MRCLGMSPRQRVGATLENYEKTPYGALTLIKTGPWMLRSELTHLDPCARSNAVARIDDDAGVNSLAKGQRSACVVHDDKWDVRYANFDIPLSCGRNENLSQLASNDGLIWVKEPKPPVEVIGMASLG